MSIKIEKIKVYGMTCTSCENRVERAVKKLNGVLNVKANYGGQFIKVEYDDELCNIRKIKAAIEDAGYSTQNSNDYKLMGILIVVVAVIFLSLKNSGFDMEKKLADASYAVIFLVGILTSIHCIGMCGGIMFSQTLSKENKNKFEVVKPAVLYNLGRVVSYTIIGGIIGAVGSVFSISITAKAAVQIFAGIFMIMMGFNIAGFSLFRKFNIKLPPIACRIKNKSGSPFVIGVLNGIMPCGPLQTMQLFALGTGSAVKGALSMFMFSIGTVPLMLIFGSLSGLLGKNSSKRILKLSGVLIIVLGLIMGNRGFALAGININPVTSLTGSSKEISKGNVAKAILKDGVQIINMTADNNGYTPNAFYVQKGIPVRWVIDGKEINSCNNVIVAQSLNIEKKLESGENVIEFNPEDKDINFSCWMGMIRGVIKIVDNLEDVDISKADSSLPPASTVPSCCAGPVTDGSDSGVSNQPSIYGNDITRVSTETLINKALVAEGYQTAKFKGIGYEFQPLIVVIGSNEKAKITFDLSDFDNWEGEYIIIDVTTGDEVFSFIAEKDVSEVEFSADKAGGYAVIKNNEILGIIESVDDLKAVDLEKIRDKYIGQ
ncbi:urease accessory protein UreH domain-containing protein [Sporanaerobacter sp. PP17-6a]|uniref:urease accessory protein UreH domain-containing protein n=1 Tax=Sporanaerobacter sp. PP17-6a TaxID=1891289 RepID=UPI00089FE033|nr:sulfite exporter TauE/SafE family protein [Sporanaerobacter sp. PP17-6a]SCL93012.1 Copper-exporting P-type ATPase A [Sporanaerobacter sp. PP17-6a]